MSETDFETRQKEIEESFEHSDDLNSAYASGYEHIFNEGLDQCNLNGSRNGGELIVPNKRLALLWRCFFRVQLTDGGWRSQDSNHQLQHPFVYSTAQIQIDPSRTYPKFTGYTTHEKITSPKKHFDVVPEEFSKMVYAIRLAFNSDDYGYDDLMDDLAIFEQMEYVIGEKENCSQCNPDIY